MATDITVKGKWQNADKTPAAGSITFELTSPLLDAAGKIITTPKEIVAWLDAQGEISVVLVATNDPGTQPVGVAYTLTERIQGANKSRRYDIEVPYDSPGKILDLSKVVPASVTPVYTYALASALTQGLADAATDAQSKADAAQAAAIAAAATDAQGRVDALAGQFDLPSQAVAGEPVWLTPATILAPLVTEAVWLSYTVPACDYAILRWLWGHVDYLNSGAKTIRCHIDIVIGGSTPYRLLDISGLTTREVDAVVQPMFVMREGDTVTVYATNTDVVNKVVNATIGVELYGGE